MSSTAYQTRIPGTSAFGWTIGSFFRPLHALIVAPSQLFLLTLVLMLFHPPDFNFHSIDRAAFGLLILVVLLRVCVLRNPIQWSGAVTTPMLGLLLLAFSGAVSQPNDAETWSLFAAKWLVPFTLYQLAAYIFHDARSLRRFETFSLIVLGYLSLMAVFFLLDARQFIFPRYILDEGLGYHADRARGPFLQAVANGVALNLLGLVALNSFRRRRLRGVLALLFLVALPLAIVATQDPRRLAVFCHVTSAVAFLVSEPAVAARVLMLRARWRYRIGNGRHLCGWRHFAGRSIGRAWTRDVPHGYLSGWLGDVLGEAACRMGCS